MKKNLFIKEETVVNDRRHEVDIDKNGIKEDGIGSGK